MLSSSRLTCAGALVVALVAGCTSDANPVAPDAPPSGAGPGRSDVTIPGAGTTLGGILYRADPSTPKPAIVVLHGWQAPGTNGAAVVDPRARRFSEEGYVALALALRGWPPSGGADDCGLLQPDDAAAAVEWLRLQPGVEAGRIAIVGFSQGGQVALLAAARDPRLRAVVAYFPVTDVARWKATTTNADIPGYVTAVCEPGGTAPRSPVAQASRITLPVLLVHGDRDTRVPTEQSTLFRDARSGHSTELFLVPGAQHGFTADEEALAKPVVDRFLSSSLR
jgi:dipeptidyl aminopeptidase/acylaminoacyl peptidase